MTRLYEYQMMRPLDEDELPAGSVAHEVYKDQRGIFGWWGRVLYARPLTGDEIDRCGLDGPVTAWG